MKNEKQSYSASPEREKQIKQSEKQKTELFCYHGERKAEGDNAKKRNKEWKRNNWMEKVRGQRKKKDEKER